MDSYGGEINITSKTSDEHPIHHGTTFFLTFDKVDVQGNRFVAA
jgi:hypothetical protein